MSISAEETRPDEAIGAPEPTLDDEVDRVIEEVSREFVALQNADGHWVFELEADATIPAEYILLEHFLDEIDEDLEDKLAAYLRQTQMPDGGWPLFHEGDSDLSASVKAYYALKLVGDDPEADHMRRARAFILSRGGAAKSNVFTRIALALFGQVPWRAVPVMPVEIMLLPKWFPFHIGKVSYWSRTVIAPLLILMAKKPQAKNPRGVDIRELFVEPPEKVRDWLSSPTDKTLAHLFLALDRIIRVAEPVLFSDRKRKKAIRAAADFVTERLNGEHGLGAIFPAMANSIMALTALDHPKDDPDLATAKKSVRNLLVLKEDMGYCQPCISPVWDTGLACHALMETGDARHEAAIDKGLDWLLRHQIVDVKGDWAWQRPDLEPGGWAFQYRNDHYPDLDDTAVVGMALDRAGDPRFRESIDRAVRWVIGMQSKNGGWGSFDADNTHYYLNNIPFADHGALLDPPTADVSARCVSFLCQVGGDEARLAVERGLAYLRSEQEEDGSWFGRWGTNYVYGTWSVLSAFNVAGEDMNAPHVRRAVEWLLSRQREDGGWGEDGATYMPDRRDECKASTPSQTAWALLGLMAAGEVRNPAVRRGIEFLLRHPRRGAKWEEPWYTAVGFPRVFYLRYHGYSMYFPLWALARYRTLTRGNAITTPYGI